MPELSVARDAPARSRDWLLLAAGVFAVLFGVATIRAGGRVLLGNAEALAAAGNYVGFVLWFNFAAGFLYVLAGVGIGARRRWAVGLAIAIAVATLAVFAAFGVHVAAGGAWEPRTAAALTLRSVVWIALAWLAARRIPRPTEATAA